MNGLELLLVMEEPKPLLRLVDKSLSVAVIAVQLSPRFPQHRGYTLARLLAHRETGAPRGSSDLARTVFDHGGWTSTPLATTRLSPWRTINDLFTILTGISNGNSIISGRVTDLLSSVSDVILPGYVGSILRSGDYLMMKRKLKFQSSNQDRT